MIQAMRQLALDFLYHELAGEGDAEAWYLTMREQNMGQLLPYLVESVRESMARNYYVLYPDPKDAQVAVLEQRELKEEDKLKLPFVKSTGPNSPALGPVLKRTSKPGGETGPSSRTLATTLKAFEALGEANLPWSEYFAYSHDLLSRSILVYAGRTYPDTTALIKAIEVIPESTTAFLTILDNEGRLPGERQDYLAYLQDVLVETKYCTKSLRPVKDKHDALTGDACTVYPNSLAGAGINLTNADRLGTFSELDESNVWKKYALGAASADLLYTFSYHVQNDFYSRVAGEKALILPSLTFEQQKRQKFVREFKSYVRGIKDSGDVVYREKGLLRRFKNESNSILSITIIWATFGQRLDNVSGIVTDILPSQLYKIADIVQKVRETESPIFPVHAVSQPDLALNSLGELLRRPRGRKNQKINEGARLFELKRDLVERIYHGRVLPADRLWDELLAVAREYLMEAADSGNTYGLLNEGVGKKGSYLTLAGWVRHLAQYIHFFRQLEVYPQMSNERYQPRRAELKAFFDDARATAGLDSAEKVYAFLLGVLFGKVMEVQGARGVNVGANALTWLKRMNITGDDLPGLYIKVREKLLTYDTEKSPRVRAIIEELGHLGTQIGRPSLSKTDTGYYLLLGQSLTKTLIPAKETQS
jgi:CRISPR-associated protein Csh1